MHVHFHKHKVHMRADSWDGGKCQWGCRSEGRGRGGGLLIRARSRGSWGPLVHEQNQELRVNWSCSMGFFTQAPSPALWKALMSACLAEWYSEATCLASWYELGFSILLVKMDDS